MGWGKAWGLLFWTLLLTPLLLCGERRAGWTACRAMADLAPQGAYGVADPGGRIVASCNVDRSMVPASVVKIATVASALTILGPDHRFRTDFFLDDRSNLYIKGYGDPTLVSEGIAGLVGRLREQGLRRVQTLFIDTSAFALEDQVPGREDSDNPYDAPVGPLSVNFNSVPLVKEATGRIVSGEPQTPTLPIMRQLGQGRPAGPARINICAGGCNADERMARYAGELFQILLQQGDIPVAAFGGVRPVPAGAARLHTHWSNQTLTDISRSMLHYSSNFMANLVYLACGAQQYGYPATWSKAQRAIHGELERQLGSETAARIIQVEGAGLSRDNRVTVRAMLDLLERFRPQVDLLRRENGVAVKTGTLTGVYNLAGYLPGGRAYVILLNQPANNRDVILKRLVQQLADRPASSDSQTVLHHPARQPEN